MRRYPQKERGNPTSTVSKPFVYPPIPTLYGGVLYPFAGFSFLFFSDIFHVFLRESVVYLLRRTDSLNPRVVVTVRLSARSNAAGRSPSQLRSIPRTCPVLESRKIESLR